jgi:hypothetical protein
MGLRERSAWRGQRSNAKDRGIGFHFGYDEWVAWWVKHLGPDWMRKRGCRKGQYVMARLRDKGDYVEGNVKCVLVEDNHGEATHRGRSSPRLLTVDEIKTAYLEVELCKVLSRRLGISTSMIEQIKRGQKHRKLTIALGRPGRVVHWRMSQRQMRLNEMKRRLGRDDIWIRRL